MILYLPLSALDNKYNNELDIDIFYTRIRQLNIPTPEYLFLDFFSVIGNSDIFTIIGFNILSVPTNLQYFNDTVLSSLPLKVDVLGFSETRLDSDLIPVYQLPGYNLHTKCRNRNGGGVAMKLILIMFTAFPCMQTVLV